VLFYQILTSTGTSNAPGRDRQRSSQPSPGKDQENITGLRLVKIERCCGVGIGQKKLPDLLAALLSLLGRSARCLAANPNRFDVSKRFVMVQFRIA
jgi:hypothetical protein